MDSPPISIIDAPCDSNAFAWLIAASGSKNCPPSEKLSGVTLTTPIRWVADISSPAKFGLALTIL